MKYSFKCQDFELEMIVHRNRCTCIYQPIGSYPYVHVYDIEDQFSFPGNLQDVKDFIARNFSISL